MQEKLEKDFTEMGRLRKNFLVLQVLLIFVTRLKLWSLWKMTITRELNWNRPESHHTENLDPPWPHVLEFHLWGFSVTRFDYNRALKSHDLLKIQGLSLVEILFVKKKSLQGLLSSLNAVILTNERLWIITGHVTFKLRYNQI